MLGRSHRAAAVRRGPRGSPWGVGSAWAKPGGEVCTDCQGVQCTLCCCQVPGHAMLCHAMPTPCHEGRPPPLLQSCMHIGGPWGLRRAYVDGRSIRCHDAGSTGGVLLVLLRVFWALGEHKAKARHLLALCFSSCYFYIVLVRICLPEGGGRKDCWKNWLACSVGQRTTDNRAKQAG